MRQIRSRGATSTLASIVFLSLGVGVGVGVMFATAAHARAGSPLSDFVDTYLERFATFHPSIAAGNGIHSHDDTLEDFSPAVMRQESEWLVRARDELDRIDESRLDNEDRVDRRILLGLIDGWLLDINGVQTWKRNPMVYVAAVSDGLHNLITMESAPPTVRMHHTLAKLRAVPRLLAQARLNVQHPPRVFVTQAVVMLNGVSDLLSHDLALAFADVPDQALKRELFATAAATNVAIERYAQYLQTQAATDGGYAIGIGNLEARYRAEELIDLPAADLLAIGMRELAKTRERFADTAHQIDPSKSPLEVWHAVEADHPRKGELVPAARAMVDELLTFVRAHDLVRLPASERVEVTAAPAYDIGMASMHSSPPLEQRAVKSYYYITDAQSDWSPERQNAWLERFNYPTLADVTAHEVAPGHYVHSLFMRATSGKIRRIWIGLNPFPQPSSGQDGWAHYAEQLVSDEGFHAEDPRYRLAQTAEALTRICRLVAGIRLHSGEWNVDDATTFFATEAHLGEAAAHREAVRGTYDPTYGGYFLGKLAAFKLRHDYQAARGSDFSLRAFHEQVMTDGIAPWWAHRQLMMPGDKGAALE